MYYGLYQTYPEDTTTDVGKFLSATVRFGHDSDLSELWVEGNTQTVLIENLTLEPDGDLLDAASATLEVKEVNGATVASRSFTHVSGGDYIAELSSGLSVDPKKNYKVIVTINASAADAKFTAYPNPYERPIELS